VRNSRKIERHAAVIAKSRVPKAPLMSLDEFDALSGSSEKSLIRTSRHSRSLRP
jgi:hypothetical protein